MSVESWLCRFTGVVYRCDVSQVKWTIPNSLVMFFAFYILMFFITFTPEINSATLKDTNKIGDVFYEKPSGAHVATEGEYILKYRK